MRSSAGVAGAAPLTSPRGHVDGVDFAPPPIPYDAARRLGFRVAGITEDVVLAEIWDLVEQAVSGVLTVDELGARLQADYGLASWHAEVVARQNAQNAFAWANHQQLTAPAVLAAFPDWMFDAVLDDRTTPACAGMHGRVYPADDPIWQDFYPPLHFNCRSTVVPIEPGGAAAQGGFDGASVPFKGPNGEELLPAPGFGQQSRFSGPLDEMYDRGVGQARGHFSPDQPRVDAGKWTDTGAALSSARIESSHGLGGGINESKVVHLEGDGDAVYKPARGEKVGTAFSGAFGDQPEFYRREAAASIVNDELGFDLCPKTVVRDGPDGPGSMQEFAVGAKDFATAYKDGFSGRDLVDLNVYDAVIGNIDRHLGNVMIRDGRLVAIDNGTSFVDTSKLMPERQALLPSLGTRTMPGVLRERLRAFSARRREISARLSGTLNPGQIEAMFSRCDALVNSPPDKTLFAVIADLKGGAR